jgi:hypothetical protein
MCVDVHPSISSRLHLIPAVSSSKVFWSIVRLCVCVSDLGHLVSVAQGGEGCTMSGAVSRGFLSYNMIGLVICVLALECHMCNISICCYVK